MGKTINACRILVGKAVGMQVLGKLRKRWDTNVKMDMRKVG
jgi:uncharacterized membrane protein YqgA involved in biofilm formation